MDQPQDASDEFKAWRANEIQNYLVANIDTHATDHSTIMTHPEHAEKALAYDVAVGGVHDQAGGASYTEGGGGLDIITRFERC